MEQTTQQCIIRIQTTTFIKTAYVVGKNTFLVEAHLYGAKLFSLAVKLKLIKSVSFQNLVNFLILSEHIDGKYSTITERLLILRCIVSKLNRSS